MLQKIIRQKGGTGIYGMCGIVGMFLFVTVK
jgi:hypothetical protein